MSMLDRALDSAQWQRRISNRTPRSWVSGEGCGV